MPFFLAWASKGVGHADAVGAAVVEDVDLLYVQRLGHVVRHVRALKGVGRHHAEIDRPAARIELPGEFRVGEVGVGRGRGDRRQIALAEDRRHRLAAAAVLRPDRGDDIGVRDHLAGIGRRLRRIVLAGGGGAVVEDHGLDRVAGDAAIGVGVVDRQEGAVLDEGGVLVARPGERHVDADGDALIGGEHRARDERPGERAGERDGRQPGDQGAAGGHRVDLLASGRLSCRLREQVLRQASARQGRLGAAAGAI
jgi:hypothetical protein